MMMVTLKINYNVSVYKILNYFALKGPNLLAIGIACC